MSLSFWGERVNAFQNAFQTQLSLTSSYVRVGIRMTASSMCFMFFNDHTGIAWCGGAVLVDRTGHSPLTLTHLMHEYDVDI